MLTGLDPALNTVTVIFFFFNSLPQEGAIFLFKPQLVRSLAQNSRRVQTLLEIHHVPGEKEIMDVSPGEVSSHAHSLSPKVRPGP